ncbi:MAG TPA: nuclear transport factor 2 family protein [Chloroflexi bacterium]|nr:nuclear transport factor 2 family protein [Chloroflexota bacterium]
MTMWHATAKAGFISPGVRAPKTRLVLALVFGFFLLSLAACAENSRSTVEEEIWKLEETYFTNLYQANYEGVLALVHPQFMGWPGNLPKPISRDESAEFMKKLIPQPTPCVIRIERAGLQQSGATALTQYVLHVDCPEASRGVKTQSSRITHTWIRQNSQWKLLGGMSIDVKKE